MSDDLKDRLDIADLMVRYATGIDTKDWELFRSCFTDDVVCDYGDIGQWNGVEEITAFMIEAHKAMPHTNHMMSNVVAKVTGDTATVRTYVHVVLVAGGDPPTVIDGVGSYDDGLVRTEGGWRIARRRFTQTSLKFG